MYIILGIILLNIVLFILFKIKYNKEKKQGTQHKSLNLIPKFTFENVKFTFGVKLSDVFIEMQKSPSLENKTLDELYEMTITNRNPIEYHYAKKIRILCHKRLREKAKYHQNKNSDIQSK